MPVEILYPKIEFPVSAGTPMISPLVAKGWDHSEDFIVIDMAEQHQINGAERTFDIHLKNPLYQYVSGHMIDGKQFFINKFLLLKKSNSFSAFFQKPFS